MRRNRTTFIFNFYASFKKFFYFFLPEKKKNFIFTYFLDFCYESEQSFNRMFKNVICFSINIYILNLERLTIYSDKRILRQAFKV